MSTVSSAQLRIHPNDELAQDPEAHTAPFELTPLEIPQSVLKQQVAERIAAHRARRAQAAPDTTQPSSTPTPGSPAGPSRAARVRSANIAAAVAERYAHSQSYRAFLASEAERAVHQADAAARIATINAQAIAIAQQQLLADLDHWDLPADLSQGTVAVSPAPLSPSNATTLFDREASPTPTRASSLTSETTSGLPASIVYEAPSLTVRPFEDAVHSPAAPHLSPRLQAHRQTHPGFAFRSDDRLSQDQFEDQLEDERLALDDEIAFRHDPIFEATSAPEAIAANLIEFPRQLVASRKARPRLAEGPLRDESSALSPNSHLRIFEVESDQLSFASTAESLPTEWSSILLSALPVAEFTGDPKFEYLTSSVPQPAPISLRLMAAIVDICLILTVEVAFTAVFTLALTHLSGEHAVVEIPRTLAIAGTVGTLATLALLYQLLFFTLSDATPGMRYARIGLCTLSDENPTRSAMRRRIIATLLAACPLGFGLLWALLDEDTLGWHDRISRMYQRAY